MNVKMLNRNPMLMRVLYSFSKIISNHSALVRAKRENMNVLLMVKHSKRNPPNLIASNLMYEYDDEDYDCD